MFPCVRISHPSINHTFLQMKWQNLFYPHSLAGDQPPRDLGLARLIIVRRATEHCRYKLPRFQTLNRLRSIAHILRHFWVLRTSQSGDTTLTNVNTERMWKEIAGNIGISRGESGRGCTDVQYGLVDLETRSRSGPNLIQAAPPC